MARYDSILSTIGNTPLIRLRRLAPPSVNVFVKVESFNPMGSVKDRMAWAVVDAAQRSGDLRPGQTVIEATSGNTGIGLAMVCACTGHPLVVTMAENFSVERRKLLRFLGARVVLTPAAEKGTGMLNKARELADRHDYYLCRQFENEANAEAHSATTAREILADFRGEAIHYWVTGFGTGGTLKGVARALKRADPATRVVVAEPDNATLLGSGLRQTRHADGTPAASHPHFRPHLMQGWSPDFVSRLAEDAVTAGLVDEVQPVAGEEAMATARELARREGIFAGTSGGATLTAALAVAQRAPTGSNIVCMLPDTGERYLSTPLFAEINEAMNDEETALSRSTPGARFDVVSPAFPVDAAETAPLAADATRFVDECLAANRVVLFALAWCEFSWSVRRLFARLRVRYHSVDLDDPGLQADDLGGRIRSVLAARTGVPTIPQVFIDGALVGGCAEVLNAFDDGSLAELLRAGHIPFDPDIEIDTRSLLPNWVHPRRSA